MQWMERIQPLINILKKKKKVFMQILELIILYIEIILNYYLIRSGINIDVNQFSIDLFNFLRPKDLNLLTAISDREGEVFFYYQKKFSQLNTLDKEIAKEHFNGNFKERLVKCQTIQKILDHSKYKGVKIDFLNIDVEGAEMKVLKTLKFEIYDPTIICIEILGYRELDDKEREIKIKDDEIYKYLIGKDYKKVWSGSSYCSHLFTKS